MKHTKKTILLIAVISALLVLGTFRDLTFTSQAYHMNFTWYAAIGDRVGSSAAPLVAAFCSFCLMQGKQGWKKYVSLILGLLLSLVTGYMASKHTTILLWICISLVTAGICLFFSDKISKKDGSLDRVFVAGIVFVIVSTVVVNVLKVIWGRPRFLFMTDSSSQFVQWYRISGPVFADDALKSFPSGHTTSACALLFLPYLSLLYPTLSKHRKGLEVLSGVLIVLIALSRLFAGMHFLTDTTVAAGLCLLEFEVLQRTIIEQKTSEGSCDVVSY